MVSINPQNCLLEFTVSDCEEQFILTHFEGEEALFHGFEFHCDVLSTCLDIDSLGLLGKNVSIKIHDAETGARVFNGKVVGIQVGVIDYQQYRQTHLVIAPWLYGLAFIEDCRIFQGLTVPQIFTTICKELGIVDYDLSQLNNQYSPKDYCVQYNEATYYFLHRLFEETGIYYYYTHEERKHVLHLVDSGSVLPKHPESLQQTNVHHSEKHFYEWNVKTSFHSARLTLGNYHLKQPDEVPLIAIIQSQDDAASIQGKNQFEQYRYGNYFITNQAGQLIAGREIQAIEWPHHLIKAKGNYPMLFPGMRFNLSKHDDESALGNYLTLSVYHKAMDNTYLTGQHTDDQAQQSYINTIKCLSDQYHYQPLPLTKKPKIDGVHNAIVVGPKGKVIHADEYGRIKVRFYWERYGGGDIPITVLDEHCSCWSRLLQPAVGNSWGVQFIPRVGDEVLVGFINSDPDQPVVLNSLYNANNREPFTLPENQNISGIQTQIVDEQSGEVESRGHTLLFNDTPDQEEMMIHSEGDIKVKILDTLFHTVDGGETIFVNQEMLTQVLEGKTDINAKEIHLIVGNSRIDIDDNGVAFNTPHLELLTLGGGALKPVARVGDDHQCPRYTAETPHKGGPILKGSSFLKVNGMPVARVGDPLHCRIGTDHIKKGIESITVGDIPIAKVTSKTTHGGVITTGSSNVFIGELDPTP